MLKLLKLPRKSQIKKTSSGYSYDDSNVTCKFKGTEPSPKGFGLCARMVLEGEHAKGTDGNIWVKKGGRWVKDKTHIQSKKVVKGFHVASAKSNNKAKKSPAKSKKSPAKSKKSPAKAKKSLIKDKDNKKNELKQAKELNDKIYKTWNKISKISHKLYNNKTSIEFHPDYDGLGGWSYPTKSKYTDLKKCISNSQPKRECNKIKKLLKTDLSWMERTLNRSIKLQDKMLKIEKDKAKKTLAKPKAKATKSPSKVKTKKAKKQTKSEALKLHNEVYKVWDKVAKKSKKLYDDEEYLVPHPDGLEWGYGTYQKYLDYENCLANSKPKRECNKLVTMLKQDLTKMNKALDKVNKIAKAKSK